MKVINVLNDIVDVVYGLVYIGVSSLLKNVGISSVIIAPLEEISGSL